jgi:hypothetical protein
MKLVHDVKDFRTRLPECSPARLRGLFHLHETTEPVTTSSDTAVSGGPVFKTSNTQVLVSNEVIADAASFNTLINDALVALTRYWTTSESVELRPNVTRDDAAVALWQAANAIADHERTVRLLQDKIVRLQRTAQAMFGNVDVYDIAELLDIPTEN